MATIMAAATRDGHASLYATIHKLCVVSSALQVVTLPNLLARQLHSELHTRWAEVENGRNQDNSVPLLR